MNESIMQERDASSEKLRESSAADSPDLLSDCQIMLRFALKEGLLLPDDLRHNVAELDQDLVKMTLAPISAMPSALLETPTTAAGPPASPNELLLKVHGALSSLIAPATALTLQVSEPPSGKHRFLGGLPVLVKIASWVALGCAFGFVITSIPAAREKAKKVIESVAPAPGPSGATPAGSMPAPSPTAVPNSADTLSPTPTPNLTTSSTRPVFLNEVEGSRWFRLIKDILKSLLPSINAAFGAGLGAAFYILLSTQPYLTNRSFDPKYNAIYACRFITGLIGGIILSIALGPVIASKIEGGAFPITPGILAILGGYAAEAVQQILQRLVEVMLTAVRGDGSAQVQARSAAAQMQQSSRLQKMLLDYERESDPQKKQALLDQIHQVVAAPAAT
jgi:hypothetical protein